MHNSRLSWYRWWWMNFRASFDLCIHQCQDCTETFRIYKYEYIDTKYVLVYYVFNNEKYIAKFKKKDMMYVDKTLRTFLKTYNTDKERLKIKNSMISSSNIEIIDVERFNQFMGPYGDFHRYIPYSVPITLRDVVYIPIILHNVVVYDKNLKKMIFTHNDWLSSIPLYEKWKNVINYL